MVGLIKQSHQGVLGFTERNTIIALGSGDFYPKIYVNNPQLLYALANRAV
jgi:hypothetical protein